MREFYRDYVATGIYPGRVLHGFGVSGKIAGALGAVGEIRDAVPIIHGPVGCGFHYRYTARRRYLPVYKAQCTCLEEQDIIFGGAEKLRETVLETLRRYHPALVVIIPSTCTDMIHDEINGVVQDLRQQTGSRLIAIQSEVFSHIDKSTTRKNFAERMKKWDQPEGHCGIEYKGCGFGEAMWALVDQVMEKQPVKRNTLNLEGFAWGAGGNEILSGMKATLREIGIEVNTLLPNCTTAEIVEAPRAGLNIVRRVRWAKRMKEVFGTDYFHISSHYSYHGPDGIEQLYLKIAERFGLEAKAAGILQDRKLKTLEAIRPAKDFFRRCRFALYTRSFSNLPHLIEVYEKDFGIPLSYVCVDMNERRTAADGIAPDTVQTIVKNMGDALLKAGSRAQLLVNPSGAVMREVLDEVDYVLDGKELLGGSAGLRAVPDMNLFLPLDFENFRKTVLNLAGKVKNASAGDALLISKFSYDPLAYPMLQEEGMSCSRALWKKMWVLRGMES